MKNLIYIILLLAVNILSANSPAFSQFQADITRQTQQFIDKPSHRSLTRETRDYQVGDTQTFWRWDLSDMPPAWIQTSSTCQAVGEHCYIFVADDQWDINMTQSDVDTVLAHFENHTLAFPDQGIYDLNTEYFGPVPDELDNDPKMIIFYSALGSFQGTSFDGYFSAYNQVTEEEAQQMSPAGHSNECEMIYMTCHPLNPIAPIRLSVLAHEMQHLIHWGMDINEDTWINEGCSEYAMYLYGYPDPIVDFPNQPDNNLISWDQTFADYVQTYLFTVFLSENFGGHDVISQIVAEPANGIAGVQDALIYLSYTIPFNSVFAYWTNANFLGDYSTIDLPAFHCVSTYNNYPVSGSASVNGWAADYYKFLDGSNDLDINFSSANGDFIVNLLLINSAGESETINLVASGNQGALTLPAFEPEFDYMVMNISNITNSSQNYNFTVEESISEEMNFWAYHFNTNDYSEITATLQMSGEYCHVFVDNQIWGTDINENDVELVARVFDDSTAADPLTGIYELDTQMFGLPSDIDENGKVNILIYDIDDPDINGFFAPGDISGASYSNNMEVLYIDKNPHGSGINSSYCFSTVAHEFQHLIHYTSDPNEQTWVNEGLSCFAQTVTGWVSPYWMVMYTMNPDNNLIQWTAGPDYPQTWLFMIYLYEHYCLDDQNIINHLVAEPANGISGINAALLSTGWVDVSFSDVFENWVTANYVNDPLFMNGLFAYSDNPVGSGDYALSTVDDINLYPACETNTMQHVSVNYIYFSNLENSLKVTFMGDDEYTDLGVRFVSFAADQPYDLYQMQLDEFANGEIILPNNDDNYDSAVMIVTDTFAGITGTIEYSFIAEDFVSPSSAPEDDLTFLNNLSCYPNPFNPQTTISYAIYEPSFVSLQIYNIKGQEIKKLVSQHQTPGSYNLIWDGSDKSNNPLPSGIYYYKLNTEYNSITQKMLMLK